ARIRTERGIADLFALEGGEQALVAQGALAILTARLASSGRAEEGTTCRPVPIPLAVLAVPAVLLERIAPVARVAVAEHRISALRKAGAPLDTRHPERTGGGAP